MNYRKLVLVPIGLILCAGLIISVIKNLNKDTLFDVNNNEATVLGAFATDALVAHYTFDSVSQPTLNGQVSSPSYDLSVSQVSSDTGIIGQSFLFNASSSVKTSRPVQDDITICTWFKTSTKGVGSAPYQTRTLVSSAWPGAGADFTFGINSNSKLALSIGTNTTVDTNLFSTKSVTDNNWHYACFTRHRSSGEIKLYVNGALESSATGSNISLTTNPELTIGNRRDGPLAPYIGNIDEMRVYSRVLSASEILELYNFRGSAGAASPVSPTPAPTPTSTPVTTTTTSTTTTPTTSTTTSVSTTPSPTASSTPLAPVPTTTSVTPPVQIPLASLSQNLQASGNGVVLKNFSNINAQNRTYSVSRVFAEGEIKNFPQARVSGVLVESQADVMTRYPDQSVKHAIVSFVTSVPAQGSVSVDFVNQSTCNCGTSLALTKDQMLSGTFNFDARIEATKDGNTLTASARQMLQNGDYRYWLKGPIVTQIILEDRSTALKYDFGFKNKATFLATPYGSFRPGDTTLNVLDASDIPTPSVVKLFNERIYVCSKSGNSLQIGFSSCPNADGRKYGGTVENNTLSWGEIGTVENVSGFRPATTPTFKALHPIFVATFTPKSPDSTKVEVILENSWTQKLQDQLYDLVIRVGADLKAVYAKNDVRHIAASRWRKIFHIGSTPAPVYIDHNLIYLAKSKVIPNYNTSITLSNKAIQQTLVDGFPTSQGTMPGWKNSTKADIGANTNIFHGQVFKNQPAPGGRWDIGLFPTWQTNHLFAMNMADYRSAEMYDAVIGNAEAGNHMPYFFRESNTGKSFVNGMSSDMFGKPLSLDARPRTYSALTNRKSGDQGGDTLFTVDAFSSGGWGVDLSHEAALFYLPYILSGDWYFLESQYALASYDLHLTNPNIRVGAKGFVSSQDRGVAWALRTIAQAAFVAPDGTPEKKLYTDKLENNIAVREGSYNILDGSYYSPCTTSPYNRNTETSNWCIGKNSFNAFPNPLRFFSYGISGAGNAGEADPTKTTYVAAGFMYGYLHTTFAHIEELGYSGIRRVRETFGQNLLGQLLDAGYSPWYVQNYRTPSVDTTGKYFQSWSAVRDALQDVYKSRLGSMYNDNDYEGGYSIIAYGATSFLTDFAYNGIPGKQAWDWLVSNIRNQYLFSDNPKWAFLPRGQQASQATTTPPPSLPTPTVSISASPMNINQGQTTIISWSAQNASSCAANWTNLTTTSGSVTLSPVSNTTYSITCSGAGGSSSQSVQVSVSTNTQTTPTPAPLFMIDPVVSPEYKSAKVSVSLDSSATVRAEYSTDSSFISTTTYSSTFSNNHIIEVRGLRPGTSYNLRIRAKNPSQVENVSKTVTFSTLARPSKPPKILNVSAVSGSVILKWDSVRYELCSNIKIYRSENAFVTSPDQRSIISDLPCSSVQYRDTDVKPNTTYFYTIFLVDEYGDHSDAVSVKFTTPATTSSPSNNTQTQSNSSSGGSATNATTNTNTSSSGGGSSSGSRGSAPSQVVNISNINASSPNIAVSPTILPRTLAYGMEGGDVTVLQNFLISKGYLAPGNAIGFFGRLTEAAVKRFQTAEGIVSSGSPASTGYGVAGMLTRARITSVSSGAMNNITPIQTAPSPSTALNVLTRNLSYGSQGSDVTYLQNFLISKGYLAPGNAIGFFGRLTEAAVKRFQAEQGIVSSGDPQTTGYGNVGPSTRARIRDLSN